MRKAIRITAAIGVAVAIAGIAIASCCGKPSPTFTVGNGCMPPAGFVPPPRPDPARAVLVPHMETVLIEAPLSAVLDHVARTSLKDTIQNSSLPHVTGTHDLTKAAFGQVGSRRLTCLSDGSTLVEQVLANDRDAARDHFQYVVWDYTSPDARPVDFAVGEFTRRAIGERRTETSWTYAFALKPGRFPGALGPIGRFAFRKAFLERGYADMMRATLDAEKRSTEAEWRHQHSL